MSGTTTRCSGSATACRALVAGVAEGHLQQSMGLTLSPPSPSRGATARAQASRAGLVAALCIGVGACGALGFRGRSSALSLAERAEQGDIAALARMSLLRDSRLSSGQREIRVWFAMASGAPDLLLRVASTNDTRGASGELWAWWPLPSGDGDRSLAGTEGNLNSRTRDSVEASVTCASMFRAGGHEACRLRLKQEPDWRGVLAQLDSLRAFTLPDQDSLPRADSLVRSAELTRVAENMMVTVEVLDGAVYRTYSYTNPRSLPRSEAQRAAAIVDMIAELARRARRADARKP